MHELALAGSIVRSFLTEDKVKYIDMDVDSQADSGSLQKFYFELSHLWSKKQGGRSAADLSKKQDISEVI